MPSKWHKDCRTKCLEPLTLDKKSTKTLLDNQNMLLVNQIAAQIKLTEMLKASNDPQYLIKMKTTEIK